MGKNALARLLGEQQVRGRADRQELGQPFNDSQDHGQEIMVITFYVSTRPALLPARPSPGQTGEDAN